MNKKVLILNYGLHISGVSRVLVNFANALSERGYDVTIKLEAEYFTLAELLRPDIKLSLFLEEPHICGHRVRGFLRYYHWWIKNLFKRSAVKQYKSIVKENYDVEIAFNRGAAARIIAASINKYSKKLVWVHSDYMFCANPLAGFENVDEAAAAYRKFDSIVCVSQRAAEAFSEHFGIKEKLLVRYNVNDECQMIKKSKEPIQEIRKERFTMLAVGRLCEAKAFDILLNACKLLNNDGLDYDLWIIGSGEKYDELMKLKTDWKLDNVKLLGEKSNPYSYFSKADLYVSSSIYEGLSTTTIESLIMNVPAVVTDCTGMREILCDGEYGYIVPIDSVELYKGLKRMITDDELRNSYKEKCSERAKDFYKENTINRIEMLF